MTITKDQILQDIEFIYQESIKEKKWGIALRAKGMQAKILGLLKPQRLPKVVRFSEMTKDQLEEFIACMEEHDPSLKTLNPADYGFPDLTEPPSPTGKKSA